MLAQLLDKHGLGARVLDHEDVAPRRFAALDLSQTAMACVCYLRTSGTPSHVRYLIRRLRQRRPDMPIMVGLWPAGEEVLDDARHQATLGATHYVGTLRDCVETCVAPPTGRRAPGGRERDAARRRVGGLARELNRPGPPPLQEGGGRAIVRRVARGRQVHVDGGARDAAGRPGGPGGRHRGGAPGPGPARRWSSQTAVGLNFVDTYFREGLYPFPSEGGWCSAARRRARSIAVGAGRDRVGARRPRRLRDPRMVPTARCGSMPADRLVTLPEGVSEEVAAAGILKGLTAQYLIHTGFAVEPGQHVLVHAASGGVGLILGQWLKAKGAVAIGTMSRRPRPNSPAPMATRMS